MKEDYIKLVYYGKAVAYTSTLRPPTEEECKEKIVMYAQDLPRLKWYQSKKRLINEIKFWVNELNKINFQKSL